MKSSTKFLSIFIVSFVCGVMGLSYFVTQGFLLGFVVCCCFICVSLIPVLEEEYKNGYKKKCHSPQEKQSEHQSVSEKTAAQKS